MALPRWLGDALSVAPAHSLEWVLANVYGLAYVRIQDDLLDGEAPPAEHAVAVRLSDALYPAWLAVYHRLLGSEPAFWARFEQYLAQWRQATLASTQPMPASLEAFTAADFATLGQRGASGVQTLHLPAQRGQVGSTFQLLDGLDESGAVIVYDQAETDLGQIAAWLTACPSLTLLGLDAEHDRIHVVIGHSRVVAAVGDLTRVVLEMVGRARERIGTDIRTA